jgi:hypothetical protein
MAAPPQIAKQLGSDGEELLGALLESSRLPVWGSTGLWWERLGFHPFEPDDPDRLDLYLLTSEIGATLKRAR